MKRSVTPQAFPSETPGVPHRCAVKLRGVYDSLKRAERKAADHLLARPGSIAGSSIVDVAEQAGCSEATFVRLAQRLGYPGFPELKAEFAGPSVESPYHGVSGSDGAEEITRKVFANSVQALHDTLSALDFRECERAVQAMQKANRMAFFGLGNAAIVAREAYQKFLRLGVTAFTAEDSDLQLIVVNTQLARGDLLVAISYSGESRPVIAAARQAQSRGIAVLSLTNFPRSTLARQADISLITAVFQEHIDGEVGAKRLAQLCVLESLYVGYMLRKGERARRSLAQSSRALEENKTRPLTGPARP